LSDFISSTGDGACAVDRAQKIVLWNDAARDLFGFESQEACGRRCYELLGGSDEAGCFVCRGDCPALEIGTRTGVVPTREICARTKGGQKIWLSVSTILAPADWHDSTILIHLFRDVSSQKWNEGILEQMLSSMGNLLLHEGNGGPDAQPMEKLTQRERDILRMMAAGTTTHTIAGRLFISHTAVCVQVQNILAKLHVHNRLEAIVLALRNGLV
jgi:PAS domain S-box-containing protein